MAEPPFFLYGITGGEALQEKTTGMRLSKEAHAGFPKSLFSQSGGFFHRYKAVRADGDGHAVLYIGEKFLAQ